jgi:transcriptional regulator with XRE-family HTH domain
MASNTSSNERKKLGEKLKQARLDSRLTQQEVARDAGVHVNYYARVERGEENPSFDKLQSIKIALKIKTLEL